MLLGQVFLKFQDGDQNEKQSVFVEGILSLVAWFHAYVYWGSLQVLAAAFVVWADSMFAACLCWYKNLEVASV